MVKDTLHELAADGRAILMSTHTLPVAEELAHRIGIINEGKLIAIGTLDEIRQQAGHSGRLEEVFTPYRKSAIGKLTLVFYGKET